MTTWWRKAAAVVAVLVGMAGVAHAAPPTFRITQAFTSPDGVTQFVELTEWAGLDGQNGFAGLTLTMTGASGVRTITFADDINTTRTAYMSVIVWTSDAFDAGYFWGDGGTASYAATAPSFLDLGGGTLDFAGVDAFALPSLPLDGVNAVYGDRRIAPATLPAECATAPCPRDPFEITTAYILEYYHYGLDRRLLTSNPWEIAALENGAVPGWRRAGGDLYTYITPREGYTTPVCRFYAPPELGNGHVLSAFADECAALAQPASGFVLESPAAFYAALPDPVTGACAVGLPVYRYWNRAGGADHRYTKFKLDLSLVYFSALVSEGYGPDGVAFCTLGFHDEGF